MVRHSDNIVSLNKRRTDAKKQVLERLYNEHGSRLRAFLRVRLNSDEDHEDLIQDVFVRLAGLDNLAEKLTRQTSSARAYVFSIANNLIVDLLRRKAVRRPHDVGQLEHMPDVEVNVSPESIVSTDEQLALVKQRILELSPRVQHAFVLSRFQFMNYRQIAAEMNVPVKRVEKYIAKALSRLREKREPESGHGTRS